VEVTHIHLVLMNFDPLGEGKLSRFVSLTATPNTPDKLAIPVKLLQLVLTGYIDIIIAVNGDVIWPLKLSWSISPGPNGTNPLARCS